MFFDKRSLSIDGPLAPLYTFMISPPTLKSQLAENHSAVVVCRIEIETPPITSQLLAIPTLQKKYATTKWNQQELLGR